nr:hypothetical protein [Streptomyces roseochromogenus]
MRHRLVVVLGLTACAVLAGTTSLPAVGEWIADAPAHVLEAAPPRSSGCSARGGWRTVHVMPWLRRATGAGRSVLRSSPCA